MPGRDRTGPWGRGPLTGRGFGYCGGANDGGGSYGRGYGRGFGRGMGYSRRRGYGRGMDYIPEPMQVRMELPPEEEENYLKGMVKELEAELEDVKKRLIEISK